MVGETLGKDFSKMQSMLKDAEHLESNISPILTINDENSYEIHHSGAIIRLQDPWNYRSGQLTEPRFPPEQASWAPFKMYYDSLTPAYIVLMRERSSGDLREWCYNHEGQFVEQSLVSARSLHFVIGEHPEYRTISVADQLFDAGYDTTARKIAIEIGRRSGIDETIAALLSAIHARAGRRAASKAYERRVGRPIGEVSAHPQTIRCISRQEVREDPEKKIIFLVQSPGELNTEQERALQGENASFLCLTFRENSPRPNYIFRPRTSWTEGRNELWRAAASAFPNFRYLIFMDDDIEFEGRSLAEGIAEFTAWLMRDAPEIGVCATPWHGTWTTAMEGPTTRGLKGFDALLNAFRRDVVDEGILLPYVQSFDHQSWHASQGLLIDLVQLMYDAHQINSLSVVSTQNRDYPRGRFPRRQIADLVNILTGFPRGEGTAPNGEDPHLWRRSRRKYFNKELRNAVFRIPI